MVRQNEKEACGMTARERMLAALRRRPTDTIPVFPRDLTLGLDLCGYSTPEVCNANGNYDAAKSARAVIAAQQRIGHDCVIGSIHDLGLDADLLGGAVHFPETGVPAITRPPITSRNDLDRAREARRSGAGRWSGYIAAHRRVSAEIGQEVAVAANVEGPVTKAGTLRGLETLAVDMLDDPGFADEVVTFATDLVIHRLFMLIDAGIDLIFIAAASDDLQLISPQQYRRYTVPNLRRIMKAIAPTGVPVIFHPHGRLTDRSAWPLVVETLETGIQGFQFAEHNDLRVAREQWGDRACILGGPDVRTVLLPGPTERIAEETRRCLDAVGTAEGFILMASCSIHRGMPPEHVRVMVREAHRHSSTAPVR